MDGYNATDSGMKTARAVVQLNIDSEMLQLQAFADDYGIACELAYNAGMWKEAAAYDRAKRHIEGAIKTLRKIPSYYA